MTSAFERKILIAAISESQSSRHAIRMAVTRFANTSAPELRRVLAGAMRQARTVKAATDTTDNMRTTMNTLENSCRDVFGFLDELKGLLEDSETEQLEGVAPKMTALGRD